MDAIEVEVDPRRLSIDPRRLSGIDREAIFIHAFPPAAIAVSRRSSTHDKPPTVVEEELDIKKPASDLTDGFELNNGSKTSIRIPPLPPLVADEWDGGWDAWSTIAGGWLAMASSFGVQNAYGVFQDYYVNAQTATPSAVSWIGSIQLFLFISMGLFSGKLVDYGYCRQSILAGSILFVFSFFMLSITHINQYYQLILSQGVGMGLGGGLIYIPSLAVQSHRWRKRRPMAMGIVFSGSAIGGIVFPVMLNKLLHSSLGFGWTVRVAAFVVLGCLAVANMLIRPRIKPAAVTVPILDQLKVLFTDVPYLFLIAGAFITLIGMFYPYFYVQIFARTHGIPDSVGFYTLAILNASSMFGRVLPNMFAAKFGVFNLTIISGICSGIVIFALFGVNSVAGIVIFAILSGFFSGAFLSLLGVAITLHALSPADIGLRMGVGFFFGATGALIGAPINGELLGDHDIWWKTLIFSGVCIAGGQIPIIISRRMVVQERGTWIV